MATLTLSLIGLPPSQNSRRHHFARARDDKQWKEDARLVALDAINRERPAGLPWQRVHVRYDFHYQRVTSVDPDNTVGRCKPVLDGLKGLVFPDDSSKYIHQIGTTVNVRRDQPAGFDVVIDECSCT